MQKQLDLLEGTQWHKQSSHTLEVPYSVLRFSCTRCLANGWSMLVNYQLLQCTNGQSLRTKSSNNLVPNIYLSSNFWRGIWWPDCQSCKLKSTWYFLFPPLNASCPLMKRILRKVNFSAVKLIALLKLMQRRPLHFLFFLKAQEEDKCR